MAEYKNKESGEIVQSIIQEIAHLSFEDREEIRKHLAQRNDVEKSYIENETNRIMVESIGKKYKSIYDFVLSGGRVLNSGSHIKISKVIQTEDYVEIYFPILECENSITPMQLYLLFEEVKEEK